MTSTPSTDRRRLFASASTFVIAMVVGVAGQPEKGASAGIDLGGKFYRAVFISGPGTLSSGDLAAVPEPARERLSTFLTRRSAFSSLYENKPQDADALQSDAKRRVIERAIVSLIDAPDINARAVEFVKSAPIAYEWEGRPAGPLAESTFAEEILKKDAKTPLAPFLYVFIAHRQRAAFEAASRGDDRAAMQAAAKQYRAFIERARTSPDPIFRLLADDLDRVAYVYTRTDLHPRDYPS
jgi:hypothetical protein